MEKFANASVNLCTTCINRISRNLRCVYKTERPLYFSTRKQRNDPVHSQNYLIHSMSLAIRMFVNIKGSARNHGLISRDLLHKQKSDLIVFPNFINQSLRLYSTNSSGSQLPPTKKSKLLSAKSPISWKSLSVVACVGIVLACGIHYLKKEKELEIKKTRHRIMGKAHLGGDWTLTDHHGNRRSSTDFRGQWILIYFGFTHCPDVCPEEIEKIVNVINRTDSDNDLPKIQPIIITVDPERDTPEALKEYCSEFSPRLLGFTGSVEEIQQATRAYRVYFSAGPKDEDKDYIVDHSIISYLVNPEGEFVDFFGQNKTASDMYSSIKFHIMLYYKNKKSESQTKN